MADTLRSIKPWNLRVGGNYGVPDGVIKFAMLEEIAELRSALASRPAEVDDKRQQDLIDVFDLTWNAAVESAAFYVEGHCADGAHHVEHILELVPPKIVVGGVTVAEVRAGRAKADADLWETAMSHAAMYVENHCLYGTEHADQIMGMKRPEFGEAPSHTTNKEK